MKATYEIWKLVIEDLPDQAMLLPSGLDFLLVCKIAQTVAGHKVIVVLEKLTHSVDAPLVEYPQAFVVQQAQCSKIICP